VSKVFPRRGAYRRARSISPRLADDALVAKVNGNLWDLNRPLEADSTLQILTPKNPEALEVYRHSTRICWQRRCSNYFRRPSWVSVLLSKTAFTTIFSGRMRSRRGSRKDREKDVGAAGEGSAVPTPVHGKGKRTELYGDQP